MDANEVAKVLLDGGALIFNVNEPYTFASGIKSPVYMDCRLLISDLEKRSSIINSLVELLRGIDCDIIAATASAGIPWASWVADRLDLPLVYVRKSQKNHGRGKKVEGSISKGSKAAVVEDLVSTGGSCLATIESLRGEGAVVEHCVSIFTYGMVESEQAFNKSGVKLHSLSNFKAAVEVAIECESITLEEAAEAKKWVADPKRWRK